MHELAAVEQFIDELLEDLKKRPSFHVKSIRARMGAGITEDSIRQGFEACTMGTALEHAELKLEERIVPVVCGCGHKKQVNVTEQDGYPYVCPECGDLVEVEPGPDLELLEVVYERVPQEAA